MKKQDFYFDLPEELIAQDPLEDRASSRLLVLDKESGERKHLTFTHILDYLKEGDCLVINNTKVIPARLIGERILPEGMGNSGEAKGAQIELLLLKRTLILRVLLRRVLRFLLSAVHFSLFSEKSRKRSLTKLIKMMMY